MGTKTCFKCQRDLLRSEFYRHPQMGDGLLGKCKDCTKRDTAEREARIRSTPEGLAADRARHREKYHRLGYGQRYRDHNSRGYQAAHDARYPEKRAARVAVGNALARGKMEKQPCEVCGDRWVDAHHPDYTKPLEVRWLCRKHHMELHRKEQAA